ncbi:2-hydroxy-3-oxopropionate reductase, partial [Chryseobacterium mucoviscidosis]
SVYNRTPEKAEDFKEKSVVCDTVEDVIKNSDIIFTMLTNDAAVKDVYQKILSLDISEKLFIDMSTISPEMTGEISSAVKIKEAG